MRLETKLIALALSASLAIACGDDGMTTDTDAGFDAGSMMMEDGGAPMEDGGTTMEDGGTTMEDGGMSTTFRGADNPPSPGTQIDRAGRPAINTALIATFSDDDTAKGMMKDGFNAATPADAADWSAAIAASLGILDSLDATCGNQLLADTEAGADRYMALAGILADDQLYVNTGSGTCGVYLGLEAEIVGALGAGEGGCGGRTPTDDIIDRSYSVLAAGILTGVDDTIANDDAAHDVDTFPFLAPYAE